MIYVLLDMIKIKEKEEQKMIWKISTYILMGSPFFKDDKTKVKMSAVS